MEMSTVLWEMMEFLLIKIPVILLVTKDLHAMAVPLEDVDMIAPGVVEMLSV